MENDDVNHCDFVHFDIRRGEQCSNTRYRNWRYCIDHIRFYIGKDSAKLVTNQDLGREDGKRLELTDYLVHNECIHNITASKLTVDQKDLKQIAGANMKLVLVPKRIKLGSSYNMSYDGYVDDEDPQVTKFLPDNNIASEMTCCYVAQIGITKGSRCAHDKAIGHNYCVKHLSNAGYQTVGIDG